MPPGPDAMPGPLTVVIFGASGDLTSRKLVPALFNLALKGRLPEGTRVLGVARTEYTDAAFRTHLEEKAREAFKSSGEPWDEAAWAKFAAAVSYVPTDVTKPGGLEPLRKWFAGVEGQGGGRRLYYLSVSPELYPELGTTLGEGG